MKQELENSIKLLEASPHARIKVEYKDALDRLSIIANNVSKSDLEAKYGSIKDFFESLNARGIKTIRVTDRKSNGSSCVGVNAPYEVSFQGGNALVVHQPIVHQAVPLAGTVNGLGYDQIHKIHDHPRLERDLVEMKAENLSLKKDNEKLRDENLKHELLGTRSVEKGKNYNDLATTFQPVILTLLQHALPPLPAAASAIGLSGASPTAMQTQFLQMVQSSDDAFLKDLLMVANTMIVNEEYDNELTELNKKYNLTA